MARKSIRRKNKKYVAYIFPFEMMGKEQAMVVYDVEPLRGFLSKRKEKKYYIVVGRGPKKFLCIKFKGCNYKNEGSFQRDIQSTFENKPYKNLRPRLEGFCKKNSLTFRLAKKV